MMYLQYFTAVPLLLGVMFSGSLSYTPEIKFKGNISESNPNVYAEKGSDIKFTCFYNYSLESLVDEYTVVWEFLPKGDGPKQKLSENRKPDPNIDSTKYTIELNYPGFGVDVSVTIKNILESDDGRYVCRLLNRNDVEVRIIAVNLVVPVPVQELDFTATLVGTDRRKSMKISPTDQNYEFDKAENFEEGKYQISCSASGSNPKPDVQIYMDKTLIKGKTGDSEMRKPNKPRTFSAFVESEVMISKHSDEQKLTCRVNVKTMEEVSASFVISNVYSRDPRVQCDPVSVVKLNSDRVFKCSVQVDKGPVNCGYVYWLSGESDDRYELNKTYDTVKPHCAEVNQTFLESSLTLKDTATNTFSKTYIIVYTGSPHHNTVRKEAQLDNDTNGVTRTKTYVYFTLVAFLITFISLWY